MRRSLVLSTESARHPFRASLPPHICMVKAANDVDARVPWRAALSLTAQDVRGFMSIYTASLVAVLAFIA